MTIMLVRKVLLINKKISFFVHYAVIEVKTLIISHTLCCY